jgi:NTE family protein
VPLDSYSFDTRELLRAAVHEYNEPFRLRRGCLKRAAAARPACLPTEDPLLRDPQQRAWFKNLPTTFELPRETIDKVVDAGRCLLHEDPEFRRMVADLGARLPETGEVCVASR